MNAELAIGLIIGLCLGAVIMGVFMGSIAHQNFEKYQHAKMMAMDFESKWLDALEGNTDRMYILKADGGEDPYIIRGRPDQQARRERASSALSEDDDAIDLTWAAGDE